MLIHRKRNDLLDLHREAANLYIYPSIPPLYLNYMKAHNVHHLFQYDLPRFPNLIQCPCYCSILKSSRSVVYNFVLRNKSTVRPTPFLKIIEQNWNSDLQIEMICGEASFALLHLVLIKRL